SLDTANDEDSLDIFDDETGEISIVATKDGAESQTPFLKNGEFQITLDGASPSPVIVTYSVLTGAGTDATPGSDYTALSGSVSLAPFITSAVVPVNVLNDTIAEGVENVRVQITGASVPGYSPSVTNGSDTVKIYSDQVVSVVATMPNAAEDSTDGEFTFYLSTPGVGPTASPTNTVINFTVATGSGQATSGTDYTSIGTSVTILAGQTSVSLPVDVLPDSILEATETVKVTITGVSGTTHADITPTSVAADKTATVSIADNDQAYVTVEAGPKAFDVVTGPDTDSNFVIEISDTSSANTLVGYQVVVPGTLTASDAQQGVDYQLRVGGPSGAILGGTSGTMTIPAGMTSTTIYLEVLSDNIVELDENVTIKLTSVSNSANPNVFLGAIGGPNLVFQDGSAIYVGGPVYLGTSDTYISSANDTLNFGGDPTLIAQEVTEDNQTLVRFENLFGAGPGMIPVGSVISAATLDLALLSGSTTANLHEIAALAAFNENAVVWNSLFYVLGGPGLQPGVELSGTPVDSAVSSFDVTSSFAGGATAFRGWAIANLGGASAVNTYGSSENATVANRPSLSIEIDMSATVVICDDDTATVSVTSNTPGAEPATPAVITLVMSNPSSTATTFSLSDLGTGSALVGSDYNPVATSVTFAPGQTTATISVTPKNDSLVEGPETVDLSINAKTAGNPDVTFSPMLPTPVTAVINDTDFTFYTISSKTNGAELAPGGSGDPSGATDGQFNLSLTVPVDVDVAMPFVLSGSATPGADYVVRDAANNVVTPSGGTYTVTIPANSFGTSIKIDVTDDTVNEDLFESVSIVLGTPVPAAARTILPGANLSDSITIEDDEQTLTAAVVASIPSTTEGGASGQFTIGLNYMSDQPTVIKYAISGTATAATNGTSPDFNASALPGATGPSYVTGTVTIAAGATQLTLPVSAFEDFVDEGPETVILT
ncbi:MAG: DNRLRE domain-containing protein, partial [Planctomycetales bacterium]|nr:DNRLRE domain-containing protein [Planctomycetales bacterium]